MHLDHLLRRFRDRLSLTRARRRGRDTPSSMPHRPWRSGALSTTLLRPGKRRVHRVSAVGGWEREDATQGTSELKILRRTAAVSANVAAVSAQN